MKLLLVTTEYKNGNTGGVESVVDFVLRSVAQLTDWQVEVASLRMSRRAKESRRLANPSSWRGRSRTNSRVEKGVVIHDVGSAWAEIEASRFMPRPWLNSLLQNADVVLVVAGTPAVCNVLRASKVPAVLQVATLVKFERRMQNARLRGLRWVYRAVSTWITGLLDEAGLRRANAVLVENRLMLAECGRRGIAEVELCPPGVDTTMFSPARRQVTRPYILMVARLGDPRKNVEGLIASYAAARSTHRVTHDLILAGLSGPSPRSLALIKELGLQEYVHVKSPVPQADLIHLFQNADVFASASFEEGLGITFLEAMSCEVPVITTDTAGALFVLDDGECGAIVPLGEDLNTRFALELARWCHDPQLRRVAGTAARSRVLSTFSEDVTAERFVGAIARVHGRSPNGH